MRPDPVEARPPRHEAARVLDCRAATTSSGYRNPTDLGLQTRPTEEKDPLADLARSRPDGGGSVVGHEIKKSRRGVGNGRAEEEICQAEQGIGDGGVIRKSGSLVMVVLGGGCLRKRWRSRS